ncbi:hypothetical protein [Phytohabitans aurantiacus]|jgi:hypothetical protein|uniref:Lipoprotein n=1 Tax=Phytohabitans aurantiacus TaxID=3016789 RepID=A0ABQ5QQT9_9ACTN|nr:hypothetical protein [Phytohabitans aurantiacus]GLH96759.1 hypothetical protein Pa4123_20330 [Phytohabitans aurantiacus]
MRRTLVLAVVTLFSVSACGGTDDTAATPTASPSTTATVAPSGPATYPGGEFEGGENPEGGYTVAQACEMTDLGYPLGESAQADVRAGYEAERRGDKAGVRKALDALQPVFTSTAATFADTASKVADPALKTALNSLSEAAAKATTFTTFAEFDTMEQLTASGEAILKIECPKAGYQLKNIK